MNLLSVLAPASKPVDPFDVGGNVVTQAATAAAIKTLQLQAGMSKDVLRLLDPSLGTRLNRHA